MVMERRGVEHMIAGRGMRTIYIVGPYKYTKSSVRKCWPLDLHVNADAIEKV